MSKQKKTYTIAVPVNRACGNQYFEVEATSRKEALALFEAGKAVFLHDEIEVTETGEPEVIKED